MPLENCLNLTCAAILNDFFNTGTGPSIRDILIANQKQPLDGLCSFCLLAIVKIISSVTDQFFSSFSRFTWSRVSNKKSFCLLEKSVYSYKLGQSDNYLGEKRKLQHSGCRTFGLQCKML